MLKSASDVCNLLVKSIFVGKNEKLDCGLASLYHNDIWIRVSPHRDLRPNLHTAFSIRLTSALTETQQQ